MMLCYQQYSCDWWTNDWSIKMDGSMDGSMNGSMNGWKGWTEADSRERKRGRKPCRLITKRLSSWYIGNENSKIVMCFDWLVTKKEAKIIFFRWQMNVVCGGIFFLHLHLFGKLPRPKTESIRVLAPLTVTLGNALYYFTPLWQSYWY